MQLVIVDTLCDTYCYYSYVLTNYYIYYVILFLNKHNGDDSLHSCIHSFAYSHTSRAEVYNLRTRTDVNSLRSPEMQSLYLRP
jgi:hypothetical protein